MTDYLPLSGVKVGDKLCVLQRMGSKRIVVVERVTPSGRVITPAGEFNPNGTIRGQADPWNRMTARPANEDDTEGIYRVGLVNKLSRFPWDKLSAADLKAVEAIISRYTESKP